MDGILFALTLVTALGCGVIAGVFFAFSTFVMKGLRRLQPAQGIGAMQSINVTAISPAFMAALFGTAVGCAALAVYALLHLDEPYAGYLLAGSALYVVGTIVMTMTYHVPRNNGLARVDPHSDDAERHWDRYLAEWTRWNHVRGATALAAAAALILGVRVG